MPNLPQQIARNQYIADGITTVFNYTFLVPSANSLVNDIAVYVTVAGNLPNPATDIQPLNTAYTVQGAGVITGGTITFQPGYVPPISAVITIVRNMFVGIDTDFAVAQNFNGANLDLALERLVLIMQEYFTGLQYTTLTYPINAILPSQDLNLLPQLPNNYTWVGLDGKVVATELITQIPINYLSSPFVLTGTPVTTTGAQLNYLNFATGTTGTGELVYSNGATLLNATLTNPTITGVSFTGVTINSSTLNQPIIYQPVIHGVTDGSSAGAGIVGEYISSTVLQVSAVSLTTATPSNVTSITLTAGCWEVGAFVALIFGAGATYGIGCINTVSATTVDLAFQANSTSNSGDLCTGGGYLACTPPMKRLNLTTTTTVYLVTEAGFATSTCSACGAIYATRVR